MAAPIGHIFLSLVMLSSSLADKSEKEFILGTSFPDIRYITKLDREKTHLENITLDQIKNAKTSFRSGFLFHSFVDEAREKYLQKHNAYDLAPQSKYASFCMKFCEDQMLHEKIKNLAGITQYFNTITPEEYDFGIDEKNIKQWHSFIKQYCGHQNAVKHVLTLYFSYQKYMPHLISKAIASTMVKLKLFPARIREMIDVMDEIQKNEKLKTILMNFYENFETIIKDL